jgi:hypothetical protein
VTEFTKSQSLAASTVTTSPGDCCISTDSGKSRMSKQPLEKWDGGQAACVLLQDPSCMQDMRNTSNKIQKEKSLHKSDMQQVTPRYDQSCSSVRDLVGTAITGMCL